MSHVDEKCGRCGADVVGTFICQSCRTRLHAILDDLVWVCRELEHEKRGTRKERPGVRVSGTKYAPQLVKLRASAALDAIKTTLFALVRNHCRFVQTITEVSRAVRAIEIDFDHYCNQGAIVAAMNALERAHEDAMAIIDLPIDTVRLPDCACGEKVIARRYDADEYGYRPERIHVCRVCGTQHFPEAYETEKKKVVEWRYADMMLTDRQVTEATSGRIKLARIRQWVAREKLTRDEDGKVRFGDCLALEQGPARRARQEEATYAADNAA